MTSPLAQPHAWELVAGGYADEAMPLLARYAARALELAQVGQGADVVDVACGPGTLALQAAPRCNRVAAIDFAAPMIDALRAHVGYAQLGNIDARVGDGQALPYGDGEFDAGFSMFGLMFFPDRAAGLRELRRVVKPGGRVVVSSWLPGDQVPLMRALFEAMREVAPPPAGAPPPPPPALSDEATIRAELAAAGFTAIEVHRVPFDNHYADLAALWDSAERSMAPVAVMRARFGASWPAAAERMRAVLAARLGDGPYVATLPAWLTVASA